MHESTASAERPPYWSNCENMNLPQLGRFIHDALIKRSGLSVSTAGSVPLSYQEFSDLVGLMEFKANAQKEDATIPVRPIYEGLAAPPRYFYPSQELKAARGERNRAYDRLEEAARHHHGENRIRQLNKELQKAERKLSLVRDEEESRKQDLLRRGHQYRQAREPYERGLSAWKQEVARIKQRPEANQKRQAFVDRARHRVKEAFRPKRDSGSQAPITLDFEILPPGERTDEHIRRYYREVLGYGWLREFSQDRLDKMIALPWSGWQKGKAGFYGYIVLMFDHTEKVLLECPIEGNAIYVLNSGEERLLEMSKQEHIESSEAKRIIHAGSWYQRLKYELGIE